MFVLTEWSHRWHQDVVSDLELIHGGLQEFREQAALPPLPPLRSSSDRPGPDPMDPSGQDPPEEKDSGDVSPGGNSPTMATLVEEGMMDDPMQQLGTPTFPSSFPSIQPRSSRPSLRSHDSTDDTHSPFSTSAVGRDFIAAGHISMSDAQRLFDLYVDRLDYFIYNIGGRWRTLEALRSRSPILTASILTVAALHDPQSSQIYPICNRELRRLVSASVFDRRVNRDYLRALCVASYWLSDVSWTLSGIAIRRATEVNLAGKYQGVLAEASEDAADCLRLWYHLYNCDKHLSILYSRQSLAREDLCIMGWEEFLKSPVATEQDKRLVMQLALHLVLTRVHELFGPDNGVPIPVVYSTQIAFHSHQLDHWLGVWSTALKGERFCPFVFSRNQHLRRCVTIPCRQSQACC